MMRRSPFKMNCRSVKVVFPWFNEKSKGKIQQ
jgi:hypothetical protein